MCMVFVACLDLPKGILISSIFKVREVVKCLEPWGLKMLIFKSPSHEVSRKS